MLLMEPVFVAVLVFDVIAVFVATVVVVSIAIIADVVDNTYNQAEIASDRK